MTGTFTALATEPAEQRVKADLARIVARLTAAVPPDAFMALALIGGFGRGEGAVLADAAGELHAFNDYDLILLVRAPIDEAPIRSAATDLARELQVDFVDIGVVTPRNLADAPNAVFWYECREGHRMLAGPSDAFAGLPIRDPARLPLEEATRLLINRGLALLWARLDLDDAERGGGDLSPERRRFVVNATHKAIMAMGDAVLIASGRYHLSYPERVRRLAGIDIPFASTGRTAANGAAAEGGEAADFRAAHEQATQFKLFPEIPGASVDELAAAWTRARAWHAAALAWIESNRLGRRIDNWRHYPAWLAGESFREGLRHPRGYLRERRPVEDLRGWPRYWLDPERSFRARLPFLLYGVPSAPRVTAGESRAADPETDYDASLLGVGLSNVPAEPGARQERWRGATRRLLKEWHP